MTSAPPRIARLTLAFAALFVLSGAAGLAYETVWSRLLVHVFGVTAFAVSTVLVSFMGGMALGATLLGGIADRARRPLRMFALLEAGVGVYALAFPFLLRGVDVLQGTLFGFLPDGFLVRSTVRFVLCLLLLLVPTVLMGGTLPALGQGLLRRREQVGLGVGLLYFVNTLGAAAGCFLAGFYLMPYLGLRATTLLAAALNFAVASTAWLLERRQAAPAAEPAGARAAEEADRPPRASTSPASWPLVVACGSGAAALAFEVVWFRILVMVFGSTVYSFSAMLSVFLLGLALGSIAFGALADRARRPVRLLAVTQGAVAVLSLAGSLAVNLMPAFFLKVIGALGADLGAMNRTKLLISLITLLPPAFAFGGTFPVAVRLAAAEGKGIGSRIGRVYAWNTVGAIVGSFGAGFLLLPTIGAEWTLKLVVGVALLLAFGSLLAEPGPLRIRWAVPAGLAAVVAAAALILAPPWDRKLLGCGAYFEPGQYRDASGRVVLAERIAGWRLMTFTEGYNETITSFESPVGKFITVNGSPTASDQFEDMMAQRMMGHLPMALHPGPVRKACIVGLGAGVTAGALGTHGFDRMTALELEKGVFVASRFFADKNDGILDNPRVRIRLDDGRNFLKLTDERFDVISSHPNFPSLTGSGTLFSREFFEECRARLAPGGIVCHYSPLWRTLPEDVKTIVGTFVDVFPHVRVFSTGHTVVLLGRMEPFPPVDVAELTRRATRPEVVRSLSEIGVRGPVELLSFYQFDEEEARRFAEGAPRNFDDRPRVEFFAPRGVFKYTVGMNLEALRAVRPTIEERAARLGVSGEYRSSYVALAAAYDATTDAEILLGQQKTEEAMRLAVPAAEAGQRYARFLVATEAEKSARESQRRGELAGAREQYALALRYEPDRLDSLVGFGQTSMFLGKPEDAAGPLERAVELYPRSGGAAARLGMVREMQGRREEAGVLFRHAVELEPDVGSHHGLLGHFLLRTGDLNGGLARLETAYALGDRSEGVLVALGGALLEASRGKDALEIAREAAGAYPGSREALELLARAAEAEGRRSEAEDAQKRLGAGSPPARP